MRVRNEKNGRHIAIAPGEYVVSNEKVVISTLLGSCVSACLYDPYNRIVGMNHFLLSGRVYGKDTPLCATDAGRYGIHSMELLLNEMWRRGARHGNLQAKAFGGASILRAGAACAVNYLMIGENNTAFIREFLQNENIPLLTSDLGGAVGRVIHFHSEDFAVYVRKIAAPSVKLIEKEERYWKKSLKMQEKAETKIELWQ
jgi:chemotaxis protein CheD